MSRRNRRPNAGTRHTVTAPAHDRAVASATPRLQVRRVSFALGTLAGAALSLPVTAPALTLGEIAIGSALGQPLRAMVPVQPASGEIVGPDCIVSIRAGDSALRTPPGTNIGFGKIAAGQAGLQITTARPLYEPMYALDLALRCPGGAMIVRQYVLMLDLPTTTTAATFAAPDTFNATTRVAPAPESRNNTASRPATAATAGAESDRPSTTIVSGSAYLVQPGDTLSTIAARMDDRKGLSIWQLAARIFADNPQAFIGADPDRIRLGARLMLPAPVEAAAPGTQTTAHEASPDTRPGAINTPAPVAPEQPSQEATTSTPPAAAPAAAAPAVAVLPAPQAAIRKPERVRATALRKPVAKAAAKRTIQETTEYQAPAWQAMLLGALIGVLASAALLRERLRDTLSTLGRRRQKTSSSRLAAARTAAASPPLPVPDHHQPVSTMIIEESPREVPGDDFAAPVPVAHAGVDRLDDTVESPVSDTPQSEPSMWESAEAFEFNTLAHQPDEEQSASSTLQEVLDLLENDYEQELTASQVIDPRRFTIDVAEAGDACDDDTLVRATDVKARRA